MSLQTYRSIRHTILFKELGIKKSRNEHAVLLTVPVEWSKFELERITQMFFERFNVPGIYLAPQPLLALYGCGAVSGIVVDVGYQSTSMYGSTWIKLQLFNLNYLAVNVVVDSIVQLEASTTVPVGGKHFDDYLLELFNKDESLVQQFKEKDIPLDLEFARFVKEQRGICHVLAGHEQATTQPTVGLPGVIETVASAATEDVIEDDVPMAQKEEEESVKNIPQNVDVEYKGHKVR